ncbi:MAG: hypothetical protein Q4F49_09225 [Pseudoxanthomonas suwonensis]|nr:hypothetical protein [Pseudoxanthomonas suwonensis]
MKSRRRPHDLLHRELVALAMSAPQVVASRTLRMWMADDPTSAEQQREWQRMVTEKVDASRDGWFAMQREIAGAQLRWWQDWVAWCWQPWQVPNPLLRLPQQMDDTAGRAMARGLGPARRRVAGNLRRLRRSVGR